MCVYKSLESFPDVSPYRVSSSSMTAFMKSSSKMSENGDGLIALQAVINVNVHDMGCTSLVPNKLIPNSILVFFLLYM